MECTAETTLNTVRDLKVYRPAEGGPEDDLQWRQMRKGIADLHRRAEVSQHANERFLNAVAQEDDTQTLEELTADMQKHKLGVDAACVACALGPRTKQY